MSSDTDDTVKARRRRSPLRRAIVATVAVAGVLIALVAIVTGVALAYLSPDRLTPLVNRYASRYLLADVNAARVELTLSSSFPRLELVVDSLTVDSRTLDSVSAATLDSIPFDPRRLLAVDRFAGAVSVPALLKGQIRIHDVEIHNPRVSLVKVSDSVANYLIVPPTPSDGSPSIIPDIAIDRFAITGDAPLRYYSVADTTDISGRLVTSLTRDASSAPVYRLSLSGAGAAELGDALTIAETPFGLDGNIQWSATAPYALAVEEMVVSLDSIAMTLDARIDFADTLTVSDFALRASDLRFDAIRAVIPRAMRGELDRLDTDLTLDASARLLEPYRPGVDSLPSADIALAVKGRLDYGRLRVRSLDADIAATIDGRHPDRSVLDIRKLLVIGRAMGFETSGKVSNPLSDPLIEGVFKGGIDFASLPERLADRLGADIEGFMTADARFSFRLSHLNTRNFHRLRMEGDVKLRRFRASMRDSTMQLFASGTTLRFGTGARYNLPEEIADSLLTVGLKADTIAALIDHSSMVLAATSLKAGIGARNAASTFDTTQVNPIGASISAGRVSFISVADSMTTRLRDVAARATIRRYLGKSRVPEMRLQLDARRMRYTDPYNRASLGQSHFDLSMHLRERDSLAARRIEMRRDSLRRLYPGVSDDSLRVMMRKRLASRAVADSAARVSGEVFDFDIDRSLTRWLRRLSAHGSLRVGSGRLMSKFFPIPARTSGIGLRFSTDSVAVDSALLRLGPSSLSMSGAVTNISRALTSTRQPLRARFSVTADTLDINSIAEAIFAGSDFSRHLDERPRLTDGEDDEDIEAAIKEQTDTVSKVAVIIPGNIEADLSLRAANVLYSDLWFQRIAGRIGVRGGAIHLDRLAGYTPIGSMSLSALYSAPEIDSLRFAAGMVIRRLHLKRFLHLMPQIDSLMPLLRDVDGIVTAEMAMTTGLDSLLDIKLHTLEAVMRLSGDSLSLIDSNTFRTMAKWLRFKHKDRNVIDHMDVELMVRDSRLDLFPFVFDIDRYRFGVSGSNDLGLNLDYHIAVLKSPLPFRFGVNIKGKPGRLRFSLGKARFDEKKAYAERQLTDTVRINLIDEISNVFRFGVTSGKRNARLMKIERPDSAEFGVTDTLSRSDSLLFIREGIISPVND